MKVDGLWQVFMETGAPEMYLLYSAAKKAELKDVFNDQGPGASGIELQ